MAATVLSLMVLTTIALLAGGVYLWRRGHNKRRALLMLLLAAVIAANVALWAVPGSTGGSLISGVPPEGAASEARSGS